MEATNGYANGYSKGTKMNGINGHAVGTKRTSSAARGPTILTRLFSIIARLLTWYSVITLLFRCPDTFELCDETTPRICKPYFQAKQIVVPHVEPYYNTYAAPYVDVARPYYDIASERIVAPATAYATKYGGPALTQAQAFGQSQWDQNIQPQLAVYQKIARDQYDEKVAPHVGQASAVMAPYYDIARTNALQTYHEIIWPSYEFAQPYLAQVYDVGSRFATETAIPSLFWSWNKTYVFLDTTVWPQVRVLYVQNVEPQLARIGQRLGRYRERSKNAAEVVSESVSSVTSPSSFSKPPSSVSSATPSTTASQVEEEVPIPDPSHVAKKEETEKAAPPPPAAKEADDSGKTPQEIVAEDLEQWQTKFAKAADEGASEIEDRIHEISQDMIRDNIQKIGRPLVTDLEDTAKAEYDVLKQAIIGIVQKSGPNAGDELLSATRKAGLAIKEKAQAVRSWKVSFEGDMESAITKAAESHFKILESIRDLALQRIGMKWAWMDGVTYKDWAKFHELRDKFDEWTNDLKKLIVTHPALDDTREASAEVEDAAMAVAQDAAHELARLKEVGFWKLAAADDSDDFATESTRQAAEDAEKAKIEAAIAAERAKVEAAEAARSAEEARAAEASRAAEAAKEADGTSEPEQDDPLEEAASVLEEESPATDLPDEGVSAAEQDPLESAASVLENDSPADDLPQQKPLLSEVSSAASEVAEEFSSASDSAYSAVSDSVTSVLSAASSIANDEGSDTASFDTLASTIIPGDDQTFVVNDTGSTPADEEVQQPLTPEEKAEHKLEDQLEEEIIPESVEEQPVEAETATVKPAFLGAMAQEVPNRGGPILDDDADADDTEDIVGKYTHQVQDAYASAIAQASHKYSIAMSAVSAQLYGTPEPEPVQDQIFAGISSRYAAATNAANARLKEALDAASNGIYGTATQTQAPSGFDWSQVEGVAAQRLLEGRIWAEEQYEAAKIALGLATATPTATTDKLLQKAKANYYAGLGNAQARYSEFLASVATAMSSFTAAPTPTDAAGTASSAASVAKESGSALASGASVDGLSVASAVGAGFNAAASVVNEAVNAAAQEVLDAAEAVERGVTETWENVVNKISAQIYGVPTPTAWYDSAYHEAEQYAAHASNQAAKQYEIVYSIVQELIVGKEPTFSESVLSRLQAAYATGASSAAAYLSQATKAAGDSAQAARDRANAAAAAAADAIRHNAQAERDEL